MNRLKLGLPSAVLMVAASFPNAVYADTLEERVDVGDRFTITSYRGVAFAAEDGETTKKIFLIPFF